MYGAFNAADRLVKIHHLEDWNGLVSIEAKVLDSRH